jgi:hypothetical protein
MTYAQHVNYRAPLLVRRGMISSALGATVDFLLNMPSQWFNF